MGILRRGPKLKELCFFVDDVGYRVILTPQRGGKAYVCMTFPADSPAKGDVMVADLELFEAILVELHLQRKPPNGRHPRPTPERYINGRSNSPYVTPWPILGR